MAESVIRLERRGGFTVLPTGMLRDPRLSLRTKGLFAVMLSLPEGWEYSISGLAAINGVGKDTVRSALKEMEEAGYLEREQSHGEGGRFGGNVYIIREESASAPLSEKPTTGKPSTVEPSSAEPSPENPTELNIDRSSIDLIDPPLPPQGESKERKKGERKTRKKQELSEDAKELLRGYVGEDRELAVALGALMEVRAEKRAANTARAVRMLLAELDRLSGGRREDKLLLLRQSVVNSWKSVFPLRGGQAPPSDRVVTREEVPTW